MFLSFDFNFSIAPTCKVLCLVLENGTFLRVGLNDLKFSAFVVHRRVVLVLCCGARTPIATSSFCMLIDWFITRVWIVSAMMSLMSFLLSICEVLKL